MLSVLFFVCALVPWCLGGLGASVGILRQNESGIRILDADPSIRCDEVRDGDTGPCECVGPLGKGGAVPEVPAHTARSHAVRPVPRTLEMVLCVT